MLSTEIAKMSNDEVLNSAIYNEQISYEQYNNLADMLAKTENKTAADFFRDQANREKGHLNSLIKLKKKIAPDSLLPIGENVKWITPDRGFISDVRVGVSLDDALSIVEEKENSADIFYQNAATAADNPDISELFTRLAEEEKHQHYLIQKMRTIYEQRGMIEPIDYEDLGFE